MRLIESEDSYCFTDCKKLLCWACVWMFESICFTFNVMIDAIELCVCFDTGWSDHNLHWRSQVHKRAKQSQMAKLIIYFNGICCAWGLLVWLNSLSVSVLKGESPIYMISSQKTKTKTKKVFDGHSCTRNETISVLILKQNSQVIMMKVVCCHNLLIWWKSF